MKTLVLAPTYLAALAALTSAPDAQQYEAAVSFGVFAPDVEANVGPNPTQRYRTDVPVGGNHTGSVRTTRSSIAGWADTDGHCCAFQDPTTSRGGIRWDDVVFTSPDPQATTIPVSLNLRIPTGSFSGNWLSIVRVSFNGVAAGQWSAVLDGMGVWQHSSSGGLAGYDGTGSFDFVLGPLDLAVNVPVVVEIRFDVIAEVFGPWAFQTTTQSLSIGSLQTGAVFSLPAGCTASSVQGGFVNNVQTPDAGYYLGSNPTTVLEGAAMDLASWNGIPNSPALLFVTGHNGLFNIIQQFAAGSLDASGQWVYPFTVPTGISGCTVQFHAVSLNALGKLSISNGTLVTVQ